MREGSLLLISEVQSDTIKGHRRMTGLHSREIRKELAVAGLRYIVAVVL
jgi:hypothetical protein